jgi:5-methylcytosine-specific restriction endonuclease McrA
MNQRKPRVYDTRRWQRLRRQKLRENPLCELCLKVNQIEPATVVDHLVALSAGGDPYPPLYALLSLCDRCHNTKTRVVEQLGRDFMVRGCDVNGMPLDPNHPWNRERQKR